MKYLLINSELIRNTVEIISLPDNKFKAILPNGDERYYTIDSGNVIEISKSNETIDIFTHKYR